ncbi:MAG: stage II sporulation protein M [Armatimonadetes bacterium]|nr:stage II sporulation protein M [Armatimonadota bacterium]
MVDESRRLAGESLPQSTSPRQQRWHELDGLLRRIDARGLDGLGPDGLERLTVLYRAATADLARAQSEKWPRQVQDYLNELVARAHGRIYAAQPRSRVGLRAYFLGVVPTTFRRRWPYVAASTVLTLAIAVIFYMGVRHDPALAHELMGDFADMLEDFAASGKSAGHYFADQESVQYLGGASFSTFLFLHNLKVAVLCFAFGVVYGLGTLYLLVTNAMMLGVFLAVGANGGAGLRFLSIIAPHGALELPAIFIAAGGGLLMGHALINPGKWRRADALRMAARDALALLVTTVPLFLAAGIIEGNISPRFRGLFGSDAVRFAFALGMFTVMLLYVLLGDRILSAGLRRRIPPPPPWP